MRIRWRGLELPSRVVRDAAHSTDVYGRFIIEPFEQGFGTTIGNSLRRILLSSLEGAAISAVKISGAAHEFASLDGVLEDVTEIILNIKGIVVRMEGDETRTITLRGDRPGKLTAGDIVTDPFVEVINKDHHIATLTAKTPFQCEMKVRRGRGYLPASENRTADQELGVIPIDSIFSPIVRVRFHTEDMRVGQRTNYDRLMMEVWTKGTIPPEEALVEAAAILRKHLNPFVMFDQVGSDMAEAPQFHPVVKIESNAGLQEMLDKPVSVLGLSVRASNCLEAAQVKTLRQLVVRLENELLSVRSFGKTSLHEVQRKLSDIGLSLGMKIDPSEAGAAAAAAAGRSDVAGVMSPGQVLPGENPMEAYTMDE